MMLDVKIEKVSYLGKDGNTYQGLNAILVVPGEKIKLKPIFKKDFAILSKFAEKNPDMVDVRDNTKKKTKTN